MKAIVREYQKEDVPAMRAIWNEVVAEGAAFPQTEELTPRQAEKFFVSQSSCGVAEDPEMGCIVGLYILHPNNVSRCGHIAKASYAVAENLRARRLYERLGFRQLGVIPGGFLTKDGRYVDICPYYKELL